MSNAEVLTAANAAITAGDYEGFLAHCTEDTIWTFVGDVTLEGKDAVRRWMAENYTSPPVFTVERMVADGEFVVALGDITHADPDGVTREHPYSDVWRFRDGKLAELRAFVV